MAVSTWIAEKVGRQGKANEKATTNVIASHTKFRSSKSAIFSQLKRHDEVMVPFLTPCVSARDLVKIMALVFVAVGGCSEGIVCSITSFRVLPTTQLADFILQTVACSL